MTQAQIIGFLEHHPEIGAGLHADPTACVIGRCALGRNVRLGADCVLRGDGHHITLGDDVVLGRRVTVHIAHDHWSTTIGNRVAADENSIIHACRVEDDVVIGADVVILDGSSIGAGALLDAGTVVFPGSQLAGGLRYAGQPAAPQGAVTDADREAARRAILAKFPQDRSTSKTSVFDAAASNALFVAESARVTGDVRLGADSSVFFSTVVEAVPHRITIGAETNIQDNCDLRARVQPLSIGAATTLGHNVRADSCTIGQRCLIGMGAVIEPGAVIEDDVLVAAGSVVPAGARLTSGSLWGGQPLRALSPLKDRHREMITTTITQYKGYASVFAKVPA